MEAESGPVAGAPPDAQGGRVRLRAGAVALVAGAAICAGKFAAFAATGSVAVFSDAMESIVNVAAAGLLLGSLAVAARPPDRDHPYGHGKVEFFTAGVEGALIAVAAAAILWSSAAELWRGPSVRRLDVGLLAVAGLAAANGVLGAWLLRTGRRTGSLALEADGRHLLTDVWTSAGVVVGLAGVWVTGLVLLDPLVAIAVALNILYTGWRLVRRAVGGLMDEADEALLRRVAAALERERRPWWIDVHHLRTWRSGARQHTDLHLAVPRYFDADRLHAVSEEVRRAVLEATGLPGDVIVHFDPCRPRQCPGCAVPECPVREHAQETRWPITLEHARRGDEALESGAPLEPERLR